MYGISSHELLTRVLVLGRHLFLWGRPQNPVRKWLVTFITVTVLMCQWTYFIWSADAITLRFCCCVRPLA